MKKLLYVLFSTFFYFLFYTELGNIGSTSTDGTNTKDYGLKSTGDFENLKIQNYYYGTFYNQPDKNNAFSDPNPRDVHSKTIWEISQTIDFSNIVLKTVSNVHLTSLTIPVSLLENNSTYYWRVKFYDNRSTESNWSAIFSFTTTQTSDDINNIG